MNSTQPLGPPAVTDDHGPASLGEPAEAAHGGWRDRVRSMPGLGLVYRVSVFVVGLTFIALGFALVVLPGPLTIPPVLVGLWIWSTEFRFAERLFDRFKHGADDAWEHAKTHPISSTLITIGGLATAAVITWAVFHYELIDNGKSAIGI